MARLAPTLPHSDVAVVDEDRRADPDWRTFFAELERRVPITGTATFAAATSIAVTFAVPEKSTSYRVLIESAANRTYWPSSKATTGFTINASASNSDTVGWAILRT